jgi:hypothetical protein
MIPSFVRGDWTWGQLGTTVAIGTAGGGIIGKVKPAVPFAKGADVPEWLSNAWGGLVVFFTNGGKYFLSEYAGWANKPPLPLPDHGVGPLEKGL